MGAEKENTLKHVADIYSNKNSIFSILKFALIIKWVLNYRRSLRPEQEIIQLFKHIFRPFWTSFPQHCLEIILLFPENSAKTFLFVSHFTFLSGFHCHVFLFFFVSHFTYHKKLCGKGPSPFSPPPPSPNPLPSPIPDVSPPLFSQWEQKFQKRRQPADRSG